MSPIHGDGMEISMTRKNKALAVFFVLGCLAAAFVAGAVEVISSGIMGDKDKISKGVTIGGVSVSGMTKEQAKSTLDEYVSAVFNRQVVIRVSENEIETSYGELGLECEEDKMLDKAFALGKEGNLWKRFKTLESVRHSGKNYDLSFELSEDSLKEFVEKECCKYDIKAKNSKLSFKNGKFVASQDQIGHEVQIDKTIERIRQTLMEDIEDTADSSIIIEAVVEDTEPEYTKEMVSKCQDKIGEFSTSYATSTAARANNVQTAAGRINGTVLYPGKTFSTIKVIKDRTEENGYQSASEYSSGKVVEGIGGGVCQVSTTLYNAVINAELEVVERSPHSMVVSYVDVSRDAAISGTYKDFKFKNNTDAPVYIAATAESGQLSFRIYGHETRDSNRTIKFESEILETIEPGAPKEVVDDTKPASYRSVTQSAHVGYKARLWKIVYVDGKETERIQLNTSSYSAEPEYVTVGSKHTSKPDSSADPKKSKDPKKTDKPEKTDKPKSTERSKATAAPKATPAAQMTAAPAAPADNGTAVN